MHSVGLADTVDDEADGAGARLRGKDEQNRHGAMDLRRVDPRPRSEDDATWLRSSTILALGDRQTARMMGPKKLTHAHAAETTRPWLRDR